MRSNRDSVTDRQSEVFHRYAMRNMVEDRKARLAAQWEREERRIAERRASLELLDGSPCPDRRAS